jgi:hypothetical protein
VKLKRTSSLNPACHSLSAFSAFCRQESRPRMTPIQHMLDFNPFPQTKIIGPTLTFTPKQVTTASP